METHIAILLLDSLKAHLIPHCLPCKNGALQATRRFLQYLSQLPRARRPMHSSDSAEHCHLTRVDVPEEMGSQ